MFTKVIRHIYILVSILELKAPLIIAAYRVWRSGDTFVIVAFPHKKHWFYPVILVGKCEY